MVVPISSGHWTISSSQGNRERNTCMHWENMKMDEPRLGCEHRAFLLQGLWGSLCLSAVVYGQEAGHTLGRSPSQRTSNHAHTLRAM
ncbi:hypothetical protein GOODEAATRI_019087 [Goodea atripinnis]|uniref:MHC class I antigen n=1 Tax=Goodea atripinnis TaxID=208336 RepID=A0ABV0NC57_9TELE